MQFKNLLIVVFLILLSSVHLNAQLQIGFHYKIKNSYRPFPWFKSYSNNINYTNDNRANHVVKTVCKNKLKAAINQQDAPNSQILKIDFWGITSSPTNCNVATYVRPTDVIGGNNYFYYEINQRGTLSNVTNYISIPYSTWEIGLTTLPFKYRFSSKKDTIPSEGSANFNGGIYIGRKWGRTRFYEDKTQTHNSLAFTLAGFVTPTVIAIDSFNTKKLVKDKATELGIAFGGGFLVAYKDVSFGVFAGLDCPVTGDSDKWIYKGRPYIGFGFGYKLGILGSK